MSRNVYVQLHIQLAFHFFSRFASFLIATSPYSHYTGESSAHVTISNVTTNLK